MDVKITKMLKVCCYSCFIPLVLFPIFLGLTIYAARVDVYSCKIESLLSEECIPGDDNQLYLELSYNVSINNHSENVKYSCMYQNTLFCNRESCISQTVVGNTYLCYYTYLSKIWFLTIDTYHYDGMFTTFLILTLICSPFVIVSIIIGAIMIKG
jgi:hypothetical protein